MNLFNGALQGIFDKTKNTNNYNLYLLKQDTHNGINRVLTVMCSYGLYPLITKPSSISEFSATLTDNIFTN